MSDNPSSKVAIDEQMLQDMDQESLSRFIRSAQATLGQKHESNRREALAEANRAAQKRGFNLEELVRGDVNARKASSTAVAVNPAKYIDPNGSGRTWTGRGRRPTWYKNALSQGFSSDEMVIGAESQPEGATAET